MRYRFLIVILVACCITSCAAPRKTTLSPAALRAEPVATSYKDPGANFSQYKTFSVFPLSMISKEPKMNEIMEKQLLFQVRCLIELFGYKFVQLNEKPDFLATIGATSEYHETYIPPQTITIPWWVPSQTIVSSGSFNFNQLGAYSSYGWGNYLGTTTTPGYFIPTQITTPGRTIGYHYPIVFFKAYDAKTLQSVYEGKGVGVSDNPDVRVSGQIVLAKIFKDFTPCSDMQVLPTSSAKPIRLFKDTSINDGMLVVKALILTIDGNNYFPTVIELYPNSSLTKAGIQKEDMIISIDGVSLANKTIPEIRKLTRGTPGTKVNLEVLRKTERLSFTVTRQSYIEALQD
jgi:hypothetical protein